MLQHLAKTCCSGLNCVAKSCKVALQCSGNVATHSVSLQGVLQRFATKASALCKCCNSCCNILVTVSDATGADGSYRILLHGTYATVTLSHSSPSVTPVTPVTQLVSRSSPSVTPVTQLLQSLSHSSHSVPPVTPVTPVPQSLSPISSSSHSIPLVIWHFNCNNTKCKYYSHQVFIYLQLFNTIPFLVFPILCLTFFIDLTYVSYVKSSAQRCLYTAHR